MAGRIELWIRKNGESIGWKWFGPEDKGIFRKLQGTGRVKVRLKGVDKEEEVAAIEFLDDVAFRLKPVPWWQRILFLGETTHNMDVRKGSGLWLVP